MIKKTFSLLLIFSFFCQTQLLALGPSTFLKLFKVSGLTPSAFSPSKVKDRLFQKAELWLMEPFCEALGSPLNVFFGDEETPLSVIKQYFRLTADMDESLINIDSDTGLPTHDSYQEIEKKLSLMLPKIAINKRNEPNHAEATYTIGTHKKESYENALLVGFYLYNLACYTTSYINYCMLARLYLPPAILISSVSLFAILYYLTFLKTQPQELESLERGRDSALVCHPKYRGYQTYFIMNLSHFRNAKSSIAKELNIDEQSLEFWWGGEEPSIKDSKDIVWHHPYGSYVTQALREACYQTEKDNQSKSVSKQYPRQDNKAHKETNKAHKETNKAPHTFMYNYGMILLGDAPFEECSMRAGDKINPNLCKMYEFSTPDSFIKESTNCLEDYKKETLLYDECLIMKAKEIFRKELFEKSKENEAFSSLPYHDNFVSSQRPEESCPFVKTFHENAICLKDSHAISHLIQNYIYSFKDHLKSLDAFKSHQYSDDSLILIHAASKLRRLNMTRTQVLDGIENIGLYSNNFQSLKSIPSNKEMQNNIKALLPSFFTSEKDDCGLSLFKFEYEDCLVKESPKSDSCYKDYLNVLNTVEKECPSKELKDKAKLAKAHHHLEYFFSKYFNIAKDTIIEEDTLRLTDYLDDYSDVMKSLKYWESNDSFFDLNANYVSYSLPLFKFFRTHISEGQAFFFLRHCVLFPGKTLMLIAIPGISFLMSLRFMHFMKTKMREFYND